MYLKVKTASHSKTENVNLLNNEHLLLSMEYFNASKRLFPETKCG